MKCPVCGTDNQPGDMFCTNCGAYLDSSAVSQATIVSNAPASVSSAGVGSTAGTTIGGGLAGSGTLTLNARLQQGRYVVTKVLGQGGMGAAVLAKDTRVSNKLVVIKELLSNSSDPAQQKDDVRNFQLEVKTLAELDHPLIPTVTDSFTEGTHYYMVQEYVAGENLEDHMERLKQPMPEREALNYISQVLDILDYLSQQKPPIIHRDIKPANIIISSRNHRAYLVDFGIARADEAKSAKRKQTSALGTPGYAPPEQYQGNADARSDLYALAATLHHLLTNRDPRNSSMFAYPPVRSLNHQISADTERVLERALKMNPAERYQSAAAMKHDIDDILAHKFGIASDTSSYTLNTSGAMASNVVTPTQPARSAASSAPRSVPPSSPPPPLQMQPQQPRQRNSLLSRMVAIITVVVLIAIFLIFYTIRHTASNGQPTPIPTFGSGNGGNVTATVVPISNGIGVTTSSKGETIGLSDGRYAFDTNGADGDLKKAASQALLSGNTQGAISNWRAASAKETNDAETLIYLENQRVLTSGKPYVTIVVGTFLTGTNDLVTVGRESLQGAYVVQKEYNSGGLLPGGYQVRLLIANSGSQTNDVTAVGQQIVTAAQKDHTIIGVMGWPYSSRAQTVLQTFTNAKIPMVSQTASSDALTGASSYFFRVAPSDTSQSGVAAQYAFNTLGAKNAVVFEDTSDSYSQSLAQGFSQQFQAKGGTAQTVNYTVGDANTVASALQQALALSPAPDLIYFAGYANDVSTILEKLPSSSNLRVLGGDALYNLGGYPQAARAGFNRLRFTAFAYPDEWGVLGHGSQQPSFYTDYGKDFDPYGAHKPNSAYDFNRPPYTVVLSDDATLALVTASKNVLAGGKTSLTPDDIQQALTKINGANAIQGASGQIAFGSDGNPVDKAVLILHVSPEGFIQMDPQLGAGKLLVGQ